MCYIQVVRRLFYPFDLASTSDYDCTDCCTWYTMWVQTNKRHQQCTQWCATISKCSRPSPRHRLASTSAFSCLCLQVNPSSPPTPRWGLSYTSSRFSRERFFPLTPSTLPCFVSMLNPSSSPSPGVACFSSQSGRALVSYYINTTLALGRDGQRHINNEVYITQTIVLY